MTAARILFVSDTHLGLDLPRRARIERRRRGDDFQASFERALAPALDGIVDVVVHGGDLLDRPGVPLGVVEEALAPLRRLADRGTPVLLVPGNHERSRVPYPLLARHPLIHVFDRPGARVLDCRGVRVAFGGFPYERRDVRGRFPALLAETGLARAAADARVLCLHHCVEGATCGPGDFTFRSGHDVVRCRDLPAEVAVVLSGHVHRHQLLERDLRGQPLPAPVLYAGSVERTSFAEKDESKGYALVAVAPGRDGAGRLARWVFRPLPTRPMLVRALEVGARGGRALDALLRRVIAECPPDAILRLRLVGEPDPETLRATSAPRLRALAPPTMSVSISLPPGPRARRPVAGREGHGSGPASASG